MTNNEKTTEKVEDTKKYSEKELNDLLELNKEQLIEEEVEKRLAEAKQEFEEEKKKLREESVEFLQKKSEELAEKKALVIAEKYKELSPRMREFREQKEIVEFYVSWNALPIDMTAPKMLVMLEAWKALWLTFMECMTWMAFIKWRLTIFWPVYLSIISRAWYKIKFLNKDAKKVEVKLSWPNWEMSWEYTQEMAEKAGLWKDVYLKYPTRMLSYKAIREVQNFLCPEIMWGVILAEEINEYPTNHSNTTENELLEKLKNSWFSKNEDEIQEWEVTLEPNTQKND